MELFKQPMAVFLLVVLAICLFIQDFIYAPGTELYENVNGLFLLPIYIFIPAFIVIWFFYCYKGKKYVPLFVVASIFLNLYFSLKSSKDAYNEILNKDPYITVGLVKGFRSGKTSNSVYFSFEDLNGKSIEAACSVSDTTIFSDSILVLFNGAKPRYNKIYRKRPTEKELIKYKKGPLKLRE